MDINDPRYRLRVLNQANPSIRIASAPQPQIRVSNAPVRTPDIQVGNSVVRSSAQPYHSWSTPTTPTSGGFSGFFKSAANIVTDPLKPFASGVARLLPGGKNDLAANENLSNQLDRNQQIYGNLFKQGKINKDQYDQLASNNISDSSSTAKESQRIAATADMSKALGSAAEIPLTIFAPGESALRNAAFGAGFGAINEFASNANPTLEGTAVGAGIGGLTGGVLTKLGNKVGSAVSNFRSRGLLNKLAKTSSADEVKQLLGGVDDQTAKFISVETNPQTIQSVLNEVEQNPLANYTTLNSSSASDPGNAKDLAPGTFDARNPSQEFLPPGTHAPGSPDPVEVLSKEVVKAKSEQEFADSYKKLSGEEKAVADSALNGKTPEEFYRAVKGDSGTVLHLPDKGVHAKLTPEQAAILADETKNIPFTAEDRPHLTAGPEVLKRTNEVTQEELAAMSPNAKTALENAQKQIADTGAEAKPSGEAVGALPPEDVAAIKAAGGEAPAPPPATPQSGTAGSAVKGDISPENTAPSDVTSKPSVAQAGAQGAVDQVLGKLDEASKAYSPEAKTFSKQRGAALFRGGDAAQEAGGMAGHIEQLKALKGVKKQTGFQPIDVTPEVRDSVMTQIHNSDLLPGDRLSANTGMLKVFGHIDGAPTPSEIKLIRKALGNDVADAIEQNQQLAGMTGREKIAMIAATPKAAMATADLSAPLRQGGVLGARFPKLLAKNAAESVKYYGSPQHFQESMTAIKARPNYEIYQKMGLHTDAAEGLMGTEEALMSSLLQTKAANKALGAGYVARGADRAYSGFLTKFRADVADKIIGDLKNSGVFDQMDDSALKSLGKFINTASGRGDLGSLERHAGLLSKALFSPRLWKSRLDLLNPVYYAKLDPVARKYALQTSAAFASVAGTVLGLAAMAGATVIWDPRSADFAKIKVGNTRYDILGGLQQNIRLGAQMWTGEKIDSTTGELQTLGPNRGFGKPSRKDLLYQFFENKENPLLGYAGKVLEGTDQQGQPINKLTEAGKLLIPLNAQDMYATAQDTGSIAKGIGMGVPGIFGTGVQTYGSTPTKDVGSNGEFKGKITPDMVTGMDGKPLFDAKGRIVTAKFPAGATDLEKKAIIDNARDKAYNKVAISKLSKSDASIYDIGNKDKTLLDSTQLDKYNQIKKWVQSYGAATKVPDGANSALAQDFYKKYNTMTKADQTYWLEKGKPEQFSKTITSLLNKERSDGLSPFKPSNAVAKAYSEYEKDINSHPEYTVVDKRNKAKAFQTYAYKLNYNNNQRDLYAEGSSSDTRTLIDNKQINKADLDAAIKMDNELYNSGLTGTLKFSKKFRREYGYGIPSGGSGGLGKGGSGGSGGSSKKVDAHLSAFIPSFSQGTSAGSVPQFSRKTRTTPSFKNIDLPKSPSAPKVNINL